MDDTVVVDVPPHFVAASIDPQRRATRLSQATFRTHWYRRGTYVGARDIRIDSRELSLPQAVLYDHWVQEVASHLATQFRISADQVWFRLVPADRWVPVVAVCQSSPNILYLTHRDHPAIVYASVVVINRDALHAHATLPQVAYVMDPYAQSEIDAPVMGVHITWRHPLRPPGNTDPIGTAMDELQRRCVDVALIYGLATGHVAGHPSDRRPWPVWSALPCWVMTAYFPGDVASEPIDDSYRRAIEPLRTALRTVLHLTAVPSPAPS